MCGHMTLQHQIEARIRGLTCGLVQPCDVGVPAAQMVEREMHTLFPGDVQSVHVVYDTAKLDSLVEEYEKIHGNLTDLLDDYTSKKRRHKKFKRKTVRPAPSGP